MATVPAFWRCRAMITEPQHNYVSYLLRMWRDDEKSLWRASLESPGTREFKTFATLGELFDFLLGQTRETTQHGEDADLTFGGEPP